MKILRSGHRYELENFLAKDQPGQVIQFIEKMPVTAGAAELRTVKDGTTNEELLRVLIDRLRTQGEKLPSRENSIAITKAEECLLWLEKRTRDRQQRGVEGTMRE